MAAFHFWMIGGFWVKTTIHEKYFELKSRINDNFPAVRRKSQDGEDAWRAGGSFKWLLFVWFFDCLMMIKKMPEEQVVYD